MSKRNGYIAVWVEPNTEMLKDIAKLRKLAMFGIQKSGRGRGTPNEKGHPRKKTLNTHPRKKTLI